MSASKRDPSGFIAWLAVFPLAVIVLWSLFTVADVAWDHFGPFAGILAFLGVACCFGWLIDRIGL